MNVWGILTQTMPDYKHDLWNSEINGCFGKAEWDKRVG